MPVFRPITGYSSVALEEGFTDLVDQGFIQPHLGKTLLAIRELVNFTSQTNKPYSIEPDPATRSSAHHLRERLNREPMKHGNFPSFNVCCSTVATIYMNVIFPIRNSSQCTALAGENLEECLVSSGNEIDWPGFLELLLWILLAASFLDPGTETYSWLQQRLRGSLSRLRFSRFSWEELRSALEKFFWVDHSREMTAKHLFMAIMSTPRGHLVGPHFPFSGEEVSRRLP